MTPPPAATDTGAAAARRAWIGALDAIGLMTREPEATLASLLDGLARDHAGRPALLGEGEAFTYAQLAARANRVARWAIGRGFAAGEAVALLMPNRPAYVALWLGLTRAGCVVALVNANLTGEALPHALRAAGAGRLIVDAAHWPALAEGLPPDTRVWVDGAAGAGGWPALEPELEPHGDGPLDAAERAFPRPSDVALLISTSGTTGLPKATRVTHARVLEWSLWFAGMMGSGPDDRLYDCLPLYHSTGGVAAVGAMLVRGGSVLVARRFSASRFWDEVADGGCTIVQYIGELCRYLTLAPPHPRERAHRLRLACGNGLAGGVWEDFRDRFAIPRILEFYAATEGAVSLYNCEGRPGAIGRVPPFLAHRFPVALVRCDPDTGEPVRDAAGRCVPCADGEAGEAVGRIDPAPGPGGTAAPRRFDGYTDAAASARKVLRDAFAPGDRWFRTGDLMRRDAAGFFHFVDRLGDTFRWRGENVSTAEVAAALHALPGVADAAVYGVAVPGNEGKAGMAALAVDERFDLDALARHLARALPDYARPLFVRLRGALEATGTFKLAKARLAGEGYADAGDPVWFRDRAAGRFVSCDDALRAEIAAGRRL